MHIGSGIVKKEKEKQVSRKKRQFSRLTKFLIAFGGLLALVFVYFILTALGGTIVGKTLKTNPDLEDGLVLHWTFDGPDMDWTQTQAEVRDRSGQGNHGNAMFPPNE